jgi:hypothetical protein
LGKNLLRIDELQEKLSSRYENQSFVSGTTNNIDLMEEKALFTTQFKGKCQNCKKIDHKVTVCKAKREQQPKVETEVICNYCKMPGHYKAGNFKLLRNN